MPQKDMPVLPADSFAGKYRLVTEPERDVELTCALEVTLTPPDARGWYVVIPEGLSTLAQRKTTTRITVEGFSERFRKIPERSALQRPLFAAEIPADTAALQEALSVRVIYGTTLFSRFLVPGNPSVPPPLSSAERALYTSPTRACNFNARSVQAWIEAQGLIRRGKEGVLPFAFRAYQAVQAFLTYELPKREPDFFYCSRTIRHRQSDCGGSNLLLSAILRYNRIPMRVYCGRWSYAGNPKTTGTAHVKGEFWVDALGWVPVDATAPERGKKREAAMHFGFDAGRFFALMEESDPIIPQPGYKDFQPTWLHHRILPYRAGRQGTWEGCHLTDSWTTRNVRLIGTTWRATRAFRD